MDTEFGKETGLARTSNEGVLYMTSHHYPNVYAFDAGNGDILSSDVLDISNFSATIGEDNVHWRGINVGPTSGDLYVANSKEDYSFIARYGCVETGRSSQKKQNWKSAIHKRKHSRRDETRAGDQLDFVGYYAQQSGDNAGLNHPYEMSWYEKDGERLFVSTQDTNSVLCYEGVDQGTPVNYDDSDFPGAFVTYHGGVEDSDGNGVRGIDVDQEMNLLFVSEETDKVVYVYNASSEETNPSPLYTITNENGDLKPVGVRIGGSLFPQTLFVGDINNDVIYKFKYTARSYQLEWSSETNDHLDHPAGLALAANTLYVVAQNTNRIVMVDPDNGDYLGSLVHYDDEGIEGENLLYLDGNGC